MGDTGAIRAFRELAERFCRWAEAASSNPETDALVALRLVAGLYGQALQLPEVQPDSDTIDRSQLGARTVYDRFAQLPIRHYTMVFDPLADPPEEPVTADLADDLRDIYADLTEGLRYYSAGRPGDAVFAWRTSFAFHWGRHALGALYALHCYGPVGTSEVT
jgi:hypothetical protein